MTSCIDLDNGSSIYLPNELISSRSGRAALRRWLDAEDARPGYYGIDAFFLADPTQYKWSFVQDNNGTRRSRVVFFERILPSGLVRLNYYFTTGTCQLIHDNRHYRGRGGPSDPRRVQETYRDLTEQQFVSLLHNPPNFFRSGWKDPPCCDSSSDGYSEYGSDRSSFDDVRWC